MSSYSCSGFLPGGIFQTMQEGGTQAEHNRFAKVRQTTELGETEVTGICRAECGRGRKRKEGNTLRKSSRNMHRSLPEFLAEN